MSYKDWKANMNKMRSRVPNAIALVAVNHFKDNFAKQGFDGKKWEEVKRRYKRSKGADSTRAILSGRTGRLKGSIHKVYADFRKVVIGSDVPYAKIHNEGGVIRRNGRRVGSYSIKIPQRQFMWDSKLLNKKIISILDAELKKVFK